MILQALRGMWGKRAAMGGKDTVGMIISSTYVFLYFLKNYKLKGNSVLWTDVVGIPNLFGSNIQGSATFGYSRLLKSDLGFRTFVIDL